MGIIKASYSIIVICYYHPMNHAIILHIAIPAPLRKIFDYLPPAGSDESKLKPGARLMVPFGSRKVVGVLLGVSDKAPTGFKLKPAHQLLDDEPLIPESIMHLCHFASDYYHHPVGEVFECALPQRLRQGKVAELPQQRFWKIGSLDFDDTILKRAPKQKQLIALLKEHPEGLSDLELNKQHIARSAIEALSKKGIIEAFHQTVEIDREHVLADTAPTLNEAQQQALQQIHQSLGQFKVSLLNGVTGSGKTEVYLQAIAAVLKQGKQALVLVPEIGLTPQTIERFRARFSAEPVVLHSGLTDQERLHAWLMAQMGNAKIIIGTRSAIFTPMLNPGIIILDEEHDMSFKQQEGFRYHARDLAIVRAQHENVPVILGSATPSLETYHNALQGRYQHLILPERSGQAVLPTFTLLDVREKQLDQGLSKELMNRVAQHLKQDDESQVLVFLNRRGYAPTLMCYQCGWMANCERCESRMTLHQLPYQLHCHHCDRIARIPAACPSCNHKGALHPVGMGTERIEELLLQKFGQFGITRIDRDSTRKKGAMQKLLHDVHHGKSRILLGTQMIAKGHHFPNVTLVAIVDMDSAFFSTDFRAMERAGQLLLQVAGRAGRAEKPGEVVIQTLQPDHPTLHSFLNNPYQKVSDDLLKEREVAQLPPYSYFALMRAEGLAEQLPLEFLQQVKQTTEQMNPENVQVMIPSYAPMPKRGGRFRAQLLFVTQDRKQLHRLLKPLCEYIEQLPASRKVRWSIDVDPMEMY